MERMTAHGDFRKYVFVLDVGGGLGGGARWLTLSYGCRVLILDVVPRLLATGRRLTRRAHLDRRITAVAGRFDAIPVRDGTFTQLWIVQSLQHADDRRRALNELFRVLRPGSPLALQEIVRRADSVPVIGGPWRHGTTAEYLELLADSGFSGIECEDVGHEPAEASAITRSAEEAFLRLLGERSPKEAAAWRRTEEALQAVETIVRSPDYRTVQIFARRPSI
jgi:ubiquinone/menaquinone biosynthesis C-methylase UbiE